MGTWRNDISFAVSNGRSLADEMITKGLAEKVTKEGRDFLWLDLKKFGNNFREGYHRSHVYHIDIEIREDGGVFYFDDVVPSGHLIHAITEQFPDDILLIETKCLEFTSVHSWNKDSSWYEKGDSICTQTGKKAVLIMEDVKASFVKEPEDGFKVRLPIGTESCEWGTFYIKKENAVYCPAHDNMDPTFTILFDESEIPVYFNGVPEKMTVRNIEKKYDAYCREHIQFPDDFKDRFAAIIRGLGRGPIVKKDADKETSEHAGVENNSNEEEKGL